MTREAERKRLVGLLGKELMDYASWQTEMALAGNYDMPSVEEVIADKILKDGWFRPPCKVGDEVYVTLPKGVFKRRIFTEEVKGFSISVITDKSIFPVKMIGEIVFLTREEAEKALRKEDEGK